ncbi:Early nodulin-93 [Spatholobus suberectus]|nr:Early nodulin-93 [Spatholobus suberectus]
MALSAPKTCCLDSARQAPVSCFKHTTRSDNSKMAKRNVAANSSFERTSLASLDQKLAMAKRCSHEGVMAGAKAAVVASIATAIPTLASVRMLPWARANLNHTAQALIISTGNYSHP